MAENNKQPEIKKLKAEIERLKRELKKNMAKAFTLHDLPQNERPREGLRE